METNTQQIMATMIVYMLVVIGIGIFFARRANENSENYFLGGRSLGPWVASMSACASDMSGWLLMGVPGVAYWCGLADAVWTAIGLCLGTYINWLVVAKRLRCYSEVAGNSITVPDFFSNRFKEQDKVIMFLASAMILIFFAVYAASCFVTCGKLFNQLFGFDYRVMMVLGALFVIIYTYLGGFLAESASDFMQAIVMVFALVAVMAVGVIAAGGVDAVLANLDKIPGFLSFFTIASPAAVDGKQLLSPEAAPLFEPAKTYGWLTIISTMSWGLGYFGMPHVLLRFMAIRRVEELDRSRRIAITWCIISLASAVFIGLIGRALYPSALQTAAAAENIFIVIATALFHPLVGGIVMAGILAATISSSDSYLLIAASAFSKNIYQGIMKKDATEKQIMNVSRITLMAVSLIGMAIAYDENSIIFKVVSFAWAGFGAAFGPLMLLSLFWKRCNRAGAIAGMLAGGGMVFFWKLVLKPLGGVFGIYELLPAFLTSCAAIVIVSLLTAEPSEEIKEEFEQAKNMV